MLKKCRPLLILLLVFALLLGGAFSGCQSAPPSDQTPPDAQTPAGPDDEDKDDGNADGDKDDSGDDTDGDTDEEEGKIRLAGIFESYDAGSIKPSGWLYDEMTLMLENATLPAEEIFPELSPNTSWENMTGRTFQGQGYYLRGMIPFAYAMASEDLRDKAETWMEKLFSEQKENGDFGPDPADWDQLYWWNRMLFLQAARSYYEATKDERAYRFIDRFFRFELEELKTRPLNAWGQTRVGDNLNTVLWFYSLTGEDYLLELADVLYAAAEDFLKVFDADEYYSDTSSQSSTDSEYYIPMHGVNIAQSIKTAAIFYQISGAKEDYERYFLYRAQQDEHFGNATGMLSGSEALMDKSSIQPTELCSVVERLLSASESHVILGDPTIGDEAERIAFNALTACFSDDYSLHSYYHMPNQAISRVGHTMYRTDYDAGSVPSVVSGMPCCRYNQHGGWVAFLNGLYAKAENGGVAVLAYSPSELAAKAGGASLQLKQETNYPFEDSVRFTFDLSKSANFPFLLRIPSWAVGAEVKVNSAEYTGAAAGSYFEIDREWQDGDVVEVTFEREIVTEPRVNGSVSVSYGPLVYSLQIDENFKESVSDGNFAEYQKIDEKYTTYEVYPNSDWNYAVDPDSFTAKTREPAPGKNIFSKEGCPLVLRAKGKLLPEWTLNTDGNRANDPPLGKRKGTGDWTELTLVPYGAQTLRITYFPVAETDDGAAYGSSLAADFQSEFDCYRLGDFRAYGENISINGGTISLPQSEDMVLLDGAEFDQFCIRFDLKITSGKGNAGFLLGAYRADNGTNNLIGYGINILNNGASSMIRTGRFDTKSFAVQKESECFEYNTGDTLHVRIEVERNTARIYLGESATPLLAWQMYRYTAGHIGFRTYNVGAEFSNITIESLYGEPLYTMPSESYSAGETAITGWEFYDGDQDRAWTLRRGTGENASERSLYTDLRERTLESGSKQTAAAGAKAFYEKEYTDFVLDCDLLMRENKPNDNTQFSVMFYANTLKSGKTATDGYVFTILRNGFEFAMFKGGSWKQFKSVDKSETELADVSSYDTPLHITVRVAQQRFLLYVNNVLVFDEENPADAASGAPHFTAGKTGLDKIAVPEAPLSSSAEASVSVSGLDVAVGDAQAEYTAETDDSCLPLSVRTDKGARVFVLNESFGTVFAPIGETHLLRLKEGENRIRIKIVSQDGSQEKIYTLHILFNSKSDAV